MRRIMSLLIGIGMVIGILGSGYALVPPGEEPIFEEPFFVDDIISICITSEGEYDIINYAIVFGTKEANKAMHEACEEAHSPPLNIIMIYGAVLEKDADGNVVRRSTEWKTEWIDGRLTRMGYDVEQLEKSLTWFHETFIDPQEWPDTFVMVELLPNWNMIRMFANTFNSGNEDRTFFDEMVIKLNKKWNGLLEKAIGVE